MCGLLMVDSLFVRWFTLVFDFIIVLNFCCGYVWKWLAVVLFC